MDNLAPKPEYDRVRSVLWEKLRSELAVQGDPRVTEIGDVFDAYPYFGPMHLGGFAEVGAYNPAYWPESLGPVPVLSPTIKSSSKPK